MGQGENKWKRPTPPECSEVLEVGCGPKKRLITVKSNVHRVSKTAAVPRVMCTSSTAKVVSTLSDLRATLLFSYGKRRCCRLIWGLEIWSFSSVSSAPSSSSISNQEGSTHTRTLTDTHPHPLFLFPPFPKAPHGLSRSKRRKSRKEGGPDWR